ncbi:hypothetical protein BHE74_00004497 [Ensete ventricosum]|nr:hypothetical protein BHE74_00004497 [Ensete ventricosum]RZS25912.1 hypothetical protein BHM03_00059184 [Ensete ventricosum]
MSRLGEITYVRKVAFVVLRRDSMISTSGQFLRKRLVRPSCKKDPSQAIGAQPSPSDDQVRGVLQAGRPIAFALSYRQSPAVRAAVGWSAHRVRSVMLPTACCQGCRRLVGPTCSLCHVASRAVAHCQVAANRLRLRIFQLTLARSG